MKLHEVSSIIGNDFEFDTKEQMLCYRLGVLAAECRKAEVQEVRDAFSIAMSLLVEEITKENSIRNKELELTTARVDSLRSEVDRLLERIAKLEDTTKIAELVDRK